MRKTLSESILINLNEGIDEESMRALVSDYKEAKAEYGDPYEALEVVDADTYGLLDMLNQLKDSGKKLTKSAEKFLDGYNNADDQDEFLEDHDNYSDVDFISWIASALK